MSKHIYIDNSIRLDFSKPLEWDDIADDLVQSGITNIPIFDEDFPEDYTEEFVLFIDCLLDDYNTKRANYKSYLENSMNARLFIELRRSAVFQFPDRYNDFYQLHSTFNTAEEVDRFRTEYIHSYNSDYVGKDWQYHLLAIYTMSHEQSEYFFWDFEDFFIDKKRRAKSREDYREEYIKDHMRPEDYEYLKRYELEISPKIYRNCVYGEKKTW